MKSKLIFVLLSLLFLLQQAKVKAGNQCPCSRVKPEIHHDWEKLHSRRRLRRDTEVEDDDRIVGGYAATQTKPWVAKLWIVKMELLCGASLINKRYLLTAAHCTCRVLPCTNGTPNYKPSEELLAYLGLNYKLVEFDNRDIKGKPEYEYGVESVISHPKYKMTYDIALVKLDRDAVFIPDRLQPICLPLADDKSDIPKNGEKLEVFVSGWGRMSADCTTNEFGPIKNLKCKFPFTLKGKRHDRCARNRSPSSKVEECNEFRKARKEDYPQVPGDNIAIKVGGRTIYCYAIVKGEDGWCQGVGTDDEIDDNWGWCEPSCKLEKDSTERLAQKLQETRLEILPLSHCKKLITQGSYSFVGKNEICAGKKKKFKKTTLYEKLGPGKYERSQEFTNYLGLNANGNYTYDYYVAGTDSCNGDSGGPVYRWINGVPTLVAVVTRGFGSNQKDGCAELNFPGIYTRTAKFLTWIKENSADGLC